VRCDAWNGLLLARHARLTRRQSNGYISALAEIPITYPIKLLPSGFFPQVSSRLLTEVRNEEESDIVFLAFLLHNPWHVTPPSFVANKKEIYMRRRC
jgi:hypothetical protein